MEKNNRIKITYAKNSLELQAKGMRIGENEDEFQIEFADIKKKNEQIEAIISAKIQVSPRFLLAITERLINAGKAYEKKYEKKIGFDKF